MANKIGTIKNLTKYVVFSIGIVILYTIAEFVISTITGCHHEILSGCVYGFFGGELTLCGVIKIFKLRRGEV